MDVLQKTLTRRALLDGNLARRKWQGSGREYNILDTELPGFGLRVRSTGRAFWFVRLRRRGKERRITIGAASKVSAKAARSEARSLLAQVALEGLPQRKTAHTSRLLSQFVADHWRHIARGWKPSTALRNQHAWQSMIAPHFGTMQIAEISASDVVRWRDGCAGARECRFNRAVPVLASLLKYAEALKLRPKGSNPCRGIARYKRPLRERYLSPKEYRRLGRELMLAEAEFPAQVAVIKLLMLTGARVGEIRDLQWQWVKPPGLLLPDSKTGPKTIYLNSQAVAVLKSVPQVRGGSLVFPGKSSTKPLNIQHWWSRFRLLCGLPDVRIHDLRHSFASVAIGQNIPLATISTLLGHALPETTGRYAHLADEHIADAAQRVSGSLATAIGVGR